MDHLSSEREPHPQNHLKNKGGKKKGKRRQQQQASVDTSITAICCPSCAAIQPNTPEDMIAMLEDRALTRDEGWALFRLGALYQTDEGAHHGVARDAKRAFELNLAAAEKGVPVACNNAGAHYGIGVLGVCPQSGKTAVKWLAKAFRARGINFKLHLKCSLRLYGLSRPWEPWRSL